MCSLIVCFVTNTTAVFFSLSKCSLIKTIIIFSHYYHTFLIESESVLRQSDLMHFNWIMSIKLPNVHWYTQKKQPKQWV
jgi:hypothetical protein